MYLVANWKMYLDFDESIELAECIAQFSISKNTTLIVCPSDIALADVNRLLPKSVGRCAQDGYWIEKGAYTGAVSMEMLKAVGCEYVIVGHSERRSQFHETNEQVAKKMLAAWEWGLKPILCVGETREELETGKRSHVLREQLGSIFVDHKKEVKECFVSYEPVWAISRGGVGQHCEPRDLAVVMQDIVGWVCECVPEVDVHFLYGGSVTPENVCSYMTVDHVEGVLVGAASTYKEKLQALLEALAQ